VLPAFDEEDTIERTVETTLDTLASFLPHGAFEVIVAEDGCTDRTPAIAARLAAEDDRVRHVHSDERLGRGGALERAFSAAAGDTLVYFDTDLATDMCHLEELVESVRSGEYDVATGSRLVPDRTADRPFKRDIASRGYNALVRLFLDSSLRDHQCGFKAFDREALFALLDDVDDEHWFWDTEVLVRAQQADYRIREFPVDWEPEGDSKVDLGRDVLGMGSQIVRAWWQLFVSPRITTGVTVLAGSILSVVALALMTLYLDPAAVLDGIERADPVLVGIAALVYLVSWPVRGVRYRDILDELGFHERVGFLTGAVFISQTGNLVFPARAGDAIRAYVVKVRRGIPYTSGFASLVVERVFDLLTITVLAGTVLLGLGVSGGAGELVTAVAGANRAGRIAVIVATAVGTVAVVAVAAIVASAQSERSVVRGAAARFGTDSYADRALSVVERFVGDLHRGAGSRGAFTRIGASSLLIWAIDVVTAVLVLAAFDVGVGVVPLLAIGFFAVSVGNLAKVLPLSPGGIGLYEAAFTLIVVGLTPIAGPVAFGAAVLDHAVKNIVTIVGGAVSMLVLNVSLTTAVDESADAPQRAVSGQD
jgi:hypothetical protein